LALVKLDAVDAAVAEREAVRLAALARSLASPAIDVVGPAPAPLARLRNRYRFRFMVRGSDRAALRKVLLGLARAKPRREVRVAIDVDPVSML
jgi:primosomal protein N' (replication factor Y)